MTQWVVYIANRLWLIITIYVISLMLSAFTFSILETKTFWDGLWLSIVTSLSIGFGDIVPVTATGRLACAIFAHFWIFAIIPLVASNIIIRVIEDKHRFTDAEQLLLFERIEKIEQLMKDIAKKNNNE